jgi:Beta-lactamase
VLQQLVEDTSGLPFERVVSERVFRPLGMGSSSFSWGAARAGDTSGHDVAGRPLRRRSYGAAMAPGAMVTTGDDMIRFVAALAESRLARQLGWSEGTWDEFVAPDHPGYGMALVIGKANGHLLVGHSGTTMGYNAGFTALPLEGAGWFVLENGNGGPYLKAEIDRTLLEWKTGIGDPRYRVMQLIRAVVTFLGVLIPGLGMLALGVFGHAYASGRIVPLRRGRVAWARLGIRLAIVLALVAFVAAWLAFFHTDAFYPAYTTAWLPFPFRGVTLGFVLFAVRGALGSLSTRITPGGESVAPASAEPRVAVGRCDVEHVNPE